MVDLRTPSSPYSTLWSTTSATPVRRKGGQDRSPPSPKARSSLWPSSLGGPGSPARGTSTATLRAACALPSPPCQTAPSSTAAYAPTQSSSRLSSCIWRPFWRYESAPMRHWTARRCPSGTVSVEGMDGLRATPTSDGPTASDGTRALACSPPQRPHRGHHRVLLWGRQYRRPADGRNLLRCAMPPEPQAL
jgi:hypothetical protein